MTATIYAFVKIFEKIEYAEMFIAGQLYMNPISYFKEYTDTSGTLRGDPYEGIAACYQPHLNNICLGGVQIPSEDIVGPIILHDLDTLNKNAFCTYSLNSRGHDKISAETLSDFRKILLIHEANFGFGKHCVLITSAQEFMNRITNSIRAKSLSGRLSLVDYFDANTFNGNFEAKKIGFLKRKKYSHQREYRVIIDTKKETPQPYILDVGTLSDIAILSTPYKINQELKIQLPDGSIA